MTVSHRVKSVTPRLDAGHRKQGPLRIAIVTGSYNYIADGVALTLNRLVDYLETQGIEVLVFAPVGRSEAFPHKGTLVPVPSLAVPLRPEYRMALGFPRAAQRRLEAFAPDLVHIAVPDIQGLQALRCARRLGIPIVASFHTRWETYFQHYTSLRIFEVAALAYLKFFYQSCREVYVPSVSMIEALRADGFKVPIKLWSRGVDASRFHPMKRSEAWRQSLGIGPQDVIVVFVGRLVREKRLDVLVETLALLQKRGLAFRSVIVGDGPERGVLEKRLPDSIFTGFLGGEDLARAYASSDLFFFPSDTETFGSVTLEAMASGLPAVCADATGSRSLVEPNVTGFLARPSQSADFAGYVQQLLSDEALRRSMGIEGRRRSLLSSWGQVMGDLVSHYHAVLGFDDPIGMQDR